MGNPHCNKAKVKDPSGGPGMVTKATCEAYFAIMETGLVAGKVQCFSERPGESATGDHPDGRACDISVDDADPAAVEQGERLASWIAKYHQQLRLGDGYVLFNHKSSSGNKDWPSTLSWYDSPEFGCFGATPMPLEKAQKIADASGMNLDKSQKTLCHYDHIHVSILGTTGAANNVSYRSTRAADRYPRIRNR
ncbi:MAG: hypothetical protein HOQ05_09115 [Corynebacteriales bacterium]|nr:hypothetical protein [Mycobacteriales bacterium]